VAETIFAEGLMAAVYAYLRRYGNLRREPMVRAVTPKDRPLTETWIVDATAGLGGDGFVFASFGARVTLIEENPIVFELLQDSWTRASNVIPS